MLLLPKQTQVHADEKRRAGVQVTQKLHKKNEMSPVTSVGSLYKTQAVFCSKIADVHGIEVHEVPTCKFDSFRKIFCFLLHIRFV